MNYTHWSFGPGNTKERVIWAQAHTKNFRSNLYLTIRISRWMFDRSWIFNKSRGMQLPFLLFVVYQLKKKNWQSTNTASYIKHCHMCWHLLMFKTHRPIFCPWAHISVAWVLDLQAAGPLGEAHTSLEHQTSYASRLLEVKRWGWDTNTHRKTPSHSLWAAHLPFHSKGGWH